MRRSDGQPKVNFSSAFLLTTLCCSRPPRNSVSSGPSTAPILYIIIFETRVTFESKSNLQQEYIKERHDAQVANDIQHTQTQMTARRPYYKLQHKFPIQLVYWAMTITKSIYNSKLYIFHNFL